MTGMQDQRREASPQVILLVEDEPVLREMIAEYFRGYDFHVLEAADADEALCHLRSAHAEISIVLSDVRMPGTMDGIQLADWVRKHTPRIAVLLASGYHGHADYDGRYEIVPKPYEFRDMLTRVRSRLSKAVPA
jgi:CheY-like chemotaxis protein